MANSYWLLQEKKIISRFAKTTIFLRYGMKAKLFKNKIG